MKIYPLTIIPFICVAAAVIWACVVGIRTFRKTRALSPMVVGTVLLGLLLGRGLESVLEYPKSLTSWMEDYEPLKIERWNFFLRFEGCLFGVGLSATAIAALYLLQREIIALHEGRVPEKNRVLFATLLLASVILKANTIIAAQIAAVIVPWLYP